MFNRNSSYSYLGPLGLVYSEYYNDKKENFHNTDRDYASVIFSLFLGILAVYISWNCNTMKRKSVPVKLLNAIVAFIFAPIYLIFRIFVSCKKRL